MTEQEGQRVLAIDIKGVTAGYGRTAVLEGLNLGVGRGEMYALLGGNGAGKSTTINVILGLVRATAGDVRVCGIDVAAEPASARAMIGFLPESVALYDHLSAQENIQYLLSLAGAAADAATIEAALDRVGFEEAARGRRLATYSKGMRQRVAIALAIARDVPVLLLDEPTSGLDPQATLESSHLLERIRDRGVAVLMVTHDLLGAAAVADRIGFLERGKVVDEATASGPERFDVSVLLRRYTVATP